MKRSITMEKGFNMLDDVAVPLVLAFGLVALCWMNYHVHVRPEAKIKGSASSNTVSCTPPRSAGFTPN